MLNPWLQTQYREISQALFLKRSLMVKKGGGVGGGNVSVSLVKKKQWGCARSRKGLKAWLPNIKKLSLVFNLSLFPLLLGLYVLTPAEGTAQRWGCHEGQAGSGYREGRRRARGRGAGAWVGGQDQASRWTSGVQKGAAHSQRQQHNLWKSMIRKPIPLTSHWLLSWNHIFPGRRVGVKTQRQESHLRNQSALIRTFIMNSKRRALPPSGAHQATEKTASPPPTG